MKNSKLMLTTATLLGLALASGVNAQTAFPDEAVTPSTCAGFDWSSDMLREHPRVVEVCQEVVAAGGRDWARFSAKFVRVMQDGGVVFRVHDRRDRFIEEVIIQPAPGQVAYVNDRATPFERLNTNDTFSLYTPEGEYGFATQVDAPPEQVARVYVADAPKPAPRPAPVAVVERAPALASNQPRQPMLPRTAGPMPWLALGGMLSLLGGVGLTFRRKL
jgi:hypothetical protein